MRLSDHPIQAAVAALVLSLLLMLPAAGRAEAGRYLSSPSYSELSGELESLQNALAKTPAKAPSASQQQRLADLEALQKAVASSSDRSQLANNSSHSLGVFARYKKEPTTTPASFYVLAPGHATDDDYELVGLYVPADVSLSWNSTGGVQPTATPRIARILEGQQLKVRDLPATATDTAAKETASAPSAEPARSSSLPTGAGQPIRPSSASAGRAGAGGGVAATPAPATSASAGRPTGPGAAKTTATTTATTATTTTAAAVGYRLSLPVFAVESRAAAVASLPSFSQAELDLEPETAPVD